MQFNLYHMTQYNCFVLFLYLAFSASVVITPLTVLVEAGVIMNIQLTFHFKCTLFRLLRGNWKKIKVADATSYVIPCMSCHAENSLVFLMHVTDIKLYIQVIPVYVY